MKLTKKGFRVFTEDGTKKEFVITIPLSEISESEGVVRRSMELTNGHFDYNGINDYLLIKDVLKNNYDISTTKKVSNEEFDCIGYLNFLINWIYFFRPHWRINKEPVVIFNHAWNFTNDN